MSDRKVQFLSMPELAEKVAEERGISYLEAVQYLLLGEPVDVEEDEMGEFLDNLQTSMARSLQVPKILLGFPVVENDKVVSKDWSIVFGYNSTDEPDDECG